MPTKTEVCNYALVIHLGADPITTFGETTTKNGRQCNRVYEQVLRDLLEDHPWQFAKKTVSLNVLSDESPEEWEYAYQWPSNCQMPREIKRVSRSNLPIDFEVINNSDGNRMICTNEQDAVLIYTAYLDNPNMYSAVFRTAFALKLAEALAPTTIANNRKKIVGIMEQAEKAVLRAKSVDSKTHAETTEPDCEFITART